MLEQYPNKNFHKILPQKHKKKEKKGYGILMCGSCKNRKIKEKHAPRKTIIDKFARITDLHDEICSIIPLEEIVHWQLHPTSSSINTHIATSFLSSKIHCYEKNNTIP